MKVLNTDGSPLNSKQLRFFLQSDVYDIKKGVDELVLTVKTGRSDANRIFIDITLPDFSSLRFSGNLNQAGEPVAVAVVSADGQPSVDHKINQPGADQLTSDPLDHSNLPADTTLLDAVIAVS